MRSVGGEDGGEPLGPLPGTVFIEMGEVDKQRIAELARRRHFDQSTLRSDADAGNGLLPRPHLVASEHGDHRRTHWRLGNHEPDAVRVGQPDQVAEGA